MSSLPVRAGEAMKVTTVAPSRERTVLMMQFNCWKGPGASVPGCPLASAPLKDGQKMNRKMVPIARSASQQESLHSDWSAGVKVCP